MQWCNVECALENSPNISTKFVHMMDAYVKIGEPQCHALNLSDSERCIAQATAYNDMFCSFHAKQCFGLYMGYKRRNAELDALDSGTPAFLKQQGDGPVGNVSFKSIKDASELQPIHDHLLRQYLLLGKVIAARQLHHKHFFSVDMDYGHKVYLERLQARRLGVLRALENVEKRTGALLYEREQWFKWVRASQSEEEATREKEQKKVKLEAALFQRHWTEVQSRMAAMRAKEEKKKQDAYLEQAWKERMEQSSYESETGGEDWDPIDDVLEEEREKYLDLIRRFLWMEIEKAADQAPDTEASAHDVTTDSVGQAEVESPKEPPVRPTASALPVTVEDDLEDVEKNDPAILDKAKTSKSKSKNKKKKKSKKLANETDTPTTNTAKPPTIPERPLPNSGKKLEVGKGHIETRDEIQKRLKEGIKRDHSGLYGPQLVGTIQKPTETYHRLAPIPDEDIDKIIGDIAEIKILLFCRTLLSHATLLPAALRAKSVEEFLADPEVSDSDLRDLCLKVEQPNLQALRDACADFARGDDPEPPPPEDEVEVLSAVETLRRNMMYSDLDELNLFSAMMSNVARRLTRSIPGLHKEGKSAKSKRMKITVCGKTIWNYASEHVMARDGWLQFSIMAKECPFNEAVELCRNWDEFYELQTLTLWNFFPSAKWASWAQNVLHEEFLQMGFIPFHMEFEGNSRTMHNQVGSKGRQRRQHHVEECRNIICAHMKRGDPATNRFIDYCIMQGGNLLIAVRDGVTGQVVTAPDKDQDERWIHRSKSGLGRASKNEWEVLKEINREFFDYVDFQREWHFDFDSHYEVYIWDFFPGEKPLDLIHRLTDLLRRARRISGPAEIYAHQRPVLENITQDPETKHVRQIRPGEQVESIYETLTGPDSHFSVMTTKGKRLGISADGTADDPTYPPYMWYNATDAAEDEVLFAGGRDEGLFKEITNPIVLFESSHMPTTILGQKAEEFDALIGVQMIEDGYVDDIPSGPVDKKNSPFSDGKGVEGAEQFIYSVPPIWKEAYLRIMVQTLKREVNKERALMMDRMDFTSIKLEMKGEDLHQLDKLELMERDRSYGWKESFHLGDLEPGAREKYVETTKIVVGAQNHTFTGPVNTDWLWLCLEILDSLGLQSWYDEYVQEALVPWPHRYLAQDVTQAFVMMALFFPKLKATKIVREFLDSEAGSQFKNSRLFDPAARATEIPDRRSRDSTTERPSSFYKELEALEELDGWVDNYPWDWNLVTRPIIAKLYRAGIITPSNTPETCQGISFAAEEPHRPGQLDLFLRFEELPGMIYPKDYVARQDWPELLPRARAFAAAHSGGGGGARFAVLRLWSAPHFLPLMIGYWNRPNFTFMDSQCRSWEWKFIPKDFVGSEWSTHMTTMGRLKLVFERAEKHATGKMKGMREKMVFRGDGILVMGEDEEELLRLVTTATFALQTKPWLREIDLWKSFINVDLEFLEGLPPVWMD